MRGKQQSGQILILILLVVVVALAVGLSVASRNITNLRTSTQTEQSQRAFTAAEGGVEDVLARLISVAPTTPGAESAPINVDVGGINAEVRVKSSNIYQTAIDLGYVGQMNIDSTGVAGPATQYKIQWGLPGEVDADGAASLEISQYVPGAVPPLDQWRQYVRGVEGSRSIKETGSTVAPSNCPVDSGFTKCTVVNRYGGNATLLRIRSFWVRTTVKVEGNNGALPTQTYDISSVAQTESGVTRKVQVQRTALPQLPAVFDYVLYSNTNISR